jgi:hypothetical protein
MIESIAWFLVVMFLVSLLGLILGAAWQAAGL